MGNQQSKQNDVASASEGSSVDPVIQTFPVQGNTVYVASDVTQHFHVVDKTGEKGFCVDELDWKLKQATIKRTRSIIESLETVPLEIIRENRQTGEEFGGASTRHYDTFDQNETEVIALHQLYQEAYLDAVRQTESQIVTQEAKEVFIQQHGKRVGIIGIAGIGKTTLGKQHLKLIAESLENFNHSYVFHLNLRDFNFGSRISVLHFLTHSGHPEWEHTAESDAELLKILNNSANVYIIMDGLDEARRLNAATVAPALGLFDHATPDVIFKNIMSGRLLRNAHKLLISRPTAYHLLHPQYKPLFTVNVLGLNEASQELLFRRICQTEEQFKRVKFVLSHNSSARALCFIPVFAKTVVPYILNMDDDEYLFSIADVFMSFLGNCVRSEKFERDINVLAKIAHLAFQGMLNKKVTFDARDLADSDLEVYGLEDFITIQVSSCTPHLRILEGDKTYYFSHLLWQEFFAALRVLFATSIQQFCDLLPKLKESQWEMVLRFVFGMLNPKVQQKIKPIFLRSADDISLRRMHLKNLVVEMARDYAKTCVREFPMPLSKLTTIESRVEWDLFQNRPDDYRLFRICALAQDLRDKDFTSYLAQRLPGMILLSRTILPSQADSLCYVLCNTNHPITINIGAYCEAASFPAKSLQHFLRKIVATNHKIKKFHVSKANFDIELLAPYILDLDELALQSCTMTPDKFAFVAEKLLERENPIAFLDLSRNAMDQTCMTLLAKCINRVDRLELVQCPTFSIEAFNILCDSIAHRTFPLIELHLSRNKLSAIELECLSRCVHKINALRLIDCGIVGADLEVLTCAIANMDHRLHLLNLSLNRFGSAGLAFISSCVHNIRVFGFGACGIVPGDQFDHFTNSLAAMEEPINLLALGQNKLGKEGLDSLSRCLFNVGGLWLDDCAVSGSDLEMFTAAMNGLQNQLKWLSLAYNDLGLRGIQLLSGCISKVEVLWIDECLKHVDQLDVLSAAISNLNQPIEFVGLSQNEMAGDECSRLLKECSHKILKLVYKEKQEEDPNKVARKNNLLIPATRTAPNAQPDDSRDA